MLHSSEKYKILLTQSLCEKPNSYIINELFKRFPTITDLFHVTEEELMHINGIGKRKAQQIIATLNLSRVISNLEYSSNCIRSPQDVYSLLGAELKYCVQEHFICILLNTKNNVISRETVTIGTLNASLVHPREVFRPAIKRASASIICAHNHPSGNPEPSPEDINITKRLVEVGQIIGIDVLDHIIIGSHSYVSLKERGHI